MESVTFDGNSGVLAINGELTVYQAAQTHAEFNKAFASGLLKSLDLSGVSEFDSAGLQLVLSLRKSNAANEIALVAISPAVQSVLNLLQLEAQLLGKQWEAQA